MSAEHLRWGVDSVGKVEYFGEIDRIMGIAAGSLAEALLGVSVTLSDLLDKAIAIHDNDRGNTEDSQQPGDLILSTAVIWIASM